jgi:hypothetical protein
VRIFKNAWFNRFAKKENIVDDELKAIVSDLENGLWDADLGGGVYKKRVARPGAGKSGGYRTIVFFKSGERAFFAFGFAKSARDNIDQKELHILKEAARLNLHSTDKQLELRLDAGQWLEL